jgi:hypothetical protein
VQPELPLGGGKAIHHAAVQGGFFHADVTEQIGLPVGVARYALRLLFCGRVIHGEVFCTMTGRLSGSVFDQARYFLPKSTKKRWIESQMISFSTNFMIKSLLSALDRPERATSIDAPA